MDSSSFHKLKRPPANQFTGQSVCRCIRMKLRPAVDDFDYV
ncbi:hypothetical protein RSSM_01424 [Rhodopirellula sallentina SM41]|uniref:Uncharacterized protein n=1 Tax=Rhodopirellula sallentina SM41 TaxID=1263870 RepID=M5U6P6_9BACT|nr:hypothetical protein RSSM_01424 [Rhodopirellula sallentina SM41]